jgi:hypothetical protein
MKAESLTIGDTLLNSEGKKVVIKGIKKDYIDLLFVEQIKGNGF